MNPQITRRIPQTITLLLAAVVVALLALVSASTAAATTSPVPNPDLQPACGAKVILVLDESGSINSTAGAENAVRDAAKKFASGLADTGSQLAVIEFGSSAKRVFGYTTVTSGAGGTLATTFNPYFDGTAAGDKYDAPSQLGQWTNWEDALKKVKELNTASGVAPLVVFVTDGDPTAINTAGGVQTNVANSTAVTPAIVQADAVKAQGSHILAVGVGAALNNANSLNRLIAVSGPDVATSAGSVNLSTTDVLRITDFTSLPDALRMLVNELCKSSVTINKQVDNGQGYVPGGAGWKFDAGVSTASGTYSWITPTPTGTGSRTATTGSDSAATFQWKPSVSTTTSTITISEQTTTGYQFVSVACQVKSLANPTQQPLAVTTNGASFTANLGPTDIVTCTVKNKKMNPAIAITKDVNQSTVLANTSVVYTIKVTNTGDVALNNVTVTDPVTPACAKSIGNLAVGAYHEYTCNAAITQDTTNVATVNSKDPQGTPLAPTSDDAVVDVIAPAITITKDVDKSMVLGGTLVNWTVVVKNTGDAVLSNVMVNDPVAPGCGGYVGTLAPGASQTLECSSTLWSDTTNVATVNANDPLGNPLQESDDASVDVIAPALTITKSVDKPVVLSGTLVTWTVTVTNTGDVDLTYVSVSDPNATDCGGPIGLLAKGADPVTRTCTATITENTTNTATATGKDPLNNTLSVSDTAWVTMISPGLSIEKSVDKPVVLSGTDVTWTVTVKNTGDVDLTNVTVTDPNATDCARTIGNLPKNADPVVITCSANITEDTVNTATVTGVDPLQNVVGPAAASASVDVIHPALVIEKSVDKPIVLSGTTVTWTVMVHNTGDADLTGVAVTDPDNTDCNTTIGALAAGQSYGPITCSEPITEATSNTANVAGTDPLGNVLNDQDTAWVNVIAPGISITKSVDKPLVLAGTLVTWTISVTNTGDTTLFNVNVTDPVAPECATVIESLGAGETAGPITCTSTITADTVNTATVTATDRLQNEVGPASAVASVDVIAPAIDITKSVDKADVAPGTAVTYTIVVTNTGDAALTGVKVADPITPACDRTIGELAAGASVTYTCVATVNSTTTNVATVTGTDPLGNPLTKSDDAKVTVTPIVVIGVQSTTLGIDKRGPAKVKAGQIISYTIVVTNTGSATADNVVMRDRIPTSMSLAVKTPGVKLVKGQIEVQIGTLAPGASKTITVKFRVDRRASGFRTNTAIASASNAPSVRDSVRTRVIRIAARVVAPRVTG